MANKKTLTEKLEELKEGDFVLVGTNKRDLAYTVGHVINSDNKKLGGGTLATIGLLEPRSLAYSSYRGVEFPTFTRRVSEYFIVRDSVTEVVVGLKEIVNHLENHPSGKYKWHAEVLKRVRK